VSYTRHQGEREIKIGDNHVGYQHRATLQQGAGEHGCERRCERSPWQPHGCRGYARPLTAGTATHWNLPRLPLKASDPLHSPPQHGCSCRSECGVSGPTCARVRLPPAPSRMRTLRAQGPMLRLSHDASPTRQPAPREPPQRCRPSQKQGTSQQQKQGTRRQQKQGNPRQQQPPRQQARPIWTSQLGAMCGCPTQASCR